MTPYPVTWNLRIKLQAYYNGPPPLGTPWLRNFELDVGTTQIDLSLIPTLQALLTEDPPAIACPGLTVTVGGVSYSF